MAGFMGRLKERLSKTRGGFVGSLKRIVTGRSIDEDLFDELEEILIGADMGVETTMKVIEDLRERAKQEKLKDAEAREAERAAASLKKARTAALEHSKKIQDKIVAANNSLAVTMRLQGYGGVSDAVKQIGMNSSATFQRWLVKINELHTNPDTELPTMKERSKILDGGVGGSCNQPSASAVFRYSSFPLVCVRCVILLAVFRWCTCISSHHQSTRLIQVHHPMLHTGG